MGALADADAALEAVAVDDRGRGASSFRRLGAKLPTFPEVEEGDAAEEEAAAHPTRVTLAESIVVRAEAPATEPRAGPMASMSQLQTTASIAMSEIYLDRLIGRGTFAEVYKADWNGTPVAVKRMLGNPLADQNQLDDFFDEAAMLQSLRHPNIVLFMGVCVQLPHLCIVTEFVPRGNLCQLLQDKARRPNVPAALRLRMALDTTRGMCARPAPRSTRLAPRVMPGVAVPLPFCSPP